MSRVIYDGKRIIPAPLININKSYQKNGAGENIGSTFTINLLGTIVAFKGSPNSSGEFYTGSDYPADESIGDDSKLSAIINKQNALRELFSDQGKTFEVQALDATQPLKCNPRVISMDFPEGRPGNAWYNTSTYTITLEADKLYPEEEDDFTEYISSANESWSIDTTENGENDVIPRTYVLNHTVSAVGKLFYDETGTANTPWHEARDWVLARLGFDSVIALSSGVNNLPSYYNGYNHVRNEQLDETTGSFSVTETWVLASGTAREDFTVTSERNLSDGLWNVSINGNIEGFEQRDSDLNLTTSKYTNAVSKFTTASGLALTRAQTYSGQTLNITPLTQSISRNPVAGTINYSYNYDNRPSNIVPDSLSEVISITDNLASDVFGVVPVLGRTAGPVLQDMGTINAVSRQLNIDLVFEPTEYTGDIATLKTVMNNNPRVDSSTSEVINNIIDAADPSNNGYSTVFTEDQNEQWDFRNGRYSYSRSWIYQ